jgi:hypothetical protein
LIKRFEYVHGDVHRAHMNLQDKKKLLVEAQTKLEKTNINIASAKEELSRLKNKLTFFLKNKVNFIDVGYKDDELNLIKDQIVKLNVEIESVDQKVHNL